MEPPAKRRRRGESPLARADQDDDELSFQPHEIRAKRDPGYKLSLDRAYADNRFQATMAHIFEKYGRDFDGIGDEIDMRTGEIVINNGHVENMRNEVDVGVPGLGEDEEDEDEGILLDDLTDGEDGQASRRDHRDEEAGEEHTDGEEDEEDRIMAGREPHPQSTSLIPMSRAQVAPQTNRLPSLLSGLYGGGHLGFGPPAAFGASPLSFGSSPFATESWQLPSSLSEPWWPQDVFRRQPLLLPSPDDRYEFPVQDSGRSIWAANYRFKDNEPDRQMTPVTFGPRPPPARTRTRPVKHLLLNSAQQRQDEELDEDAILTGKSKTQDQAAELDDDDDPLISATMPPREQSCQVMDPASSPTANAMTRPQTEEIQKSALETSRSKKQSRHQELRVESVDPDPQPDVESESGPSENEQLALAKKAVDAVATGHVDSSRRSSGRARKRVEPAGEISGSQFSGERRPHQKITVLLPSVGLSSRDDYEIVDDTIEEVADSASEAPCALEASKAAQNTAPSQLASERVVPDSQKTPTPQSSGDAHKMTSHPNARDAGNAQQRAMDSVYFLSDDEMPIFPQPPRPSDGMAKRPKKPPARKGSPGPLASGTGDSVATLSSAEDGRQPNVAHPTSSGPQLSSVQSKKRLRPRKAEGSLDHGDAEQSPPPVALLEEKPRRLARELLWLKRPTMDLAPTENASTEGAHWKCLRSAGSRDNLKAASPASGRARAADEEFEHHDAAPHDTEEDHTPPETAADAFNSPPRQTPRASPTKPPSAKPTPQKQVAALSKPQTPRHTSRPTRAPSSRRSILSLLSDDANDDDEKNLDELSRSLSTAAPFLSSGAASRKIWRSSARTTEVYHTPVKRRFTDVISPGSIVRTPGGTTRTCGLDGYRCARDFCFSCL